MKIPTTSALIGLLLPCICSAQLILTTPNVPTVITFDSNTPGIYQARTGTGNMRPIAEPNAFGFSEFNANKSSAFLSTGVASTHQYTNGNGSGNGSPTLFASDANNDGVDTNDEEVGNVDQRVWRPDEIPTANSGDYSQLASNALRLSRNSGFDTNGIYFRIQNNTGSAIADWTFGANVFYFEPDANSFSNLTFSYAISNDTNVANMTFTTFGTAPAITQGSVLSTLAGTLNETVTTAGVNNGDYIVLAFRDTSGSSGSTIFLDDVTVGAVIPEPSAYALAGVMGGLAALVWRRRSK